MNDSDFKGLSRVEKILENMLGATNNLESPQSRVEALLMRLLELIEDISHGSGTVFRFLGEKEHVNDLPETGNEQGDVWFVKEKMAGFIWLVREDHPDGYWEELGEVIDTTSIVNSINGQTGDVVLDADDVGAASPTEQITVADSGAVTQALDPNKVYVFTGDLTSLTLTLNAPVAGIANIYQVFFFNGTAAVNLVYPSNVTFADAAFAPAADLWTELSIQYVYSTTEDNVTTPHYFAHGSNIEEGVK